MKIRNSFKISIANFGLVFKNLLYKAIIFLLFFVVTVLVLSKILKPITAYVADIWQELKNFFISLYNGEEATLAPLRDSVGGMLSYIGSHTGSLVLTGIITLLAVYVYKFLSGISDCVLTFLIEDYMSSVSHLSFVRILTENLKKILVYQLISTLFTIVYDIIVIAVVVGIVSALISSLSVFAILLTGVVMVLLYALMHTLKNQVMVNMLVENLGVKAAIRKGLTFSKASFWKMYVAYLTVIIIAFYLTVSVTVFTLGVGTLLILPFVSLFLACVRCVDYYTVNKKKYFIDYDTIVVPKELRDNDEELLNEVEI